MNWYIIIFFLLALALYLYTQYIRLNNQSQQEKIEAFQSLANQTPTEKLASQHDITLTFLAASEAARQMQTIAREYIALMNQPNLAARGVQTQQELISAYATAFQDITPSEQQRITEFILDLLSKVQYKYPAYYRYLVKWIQKIAFAKAQASLEGGMPHTLGNLVIMDSAWFSSPRATTLLHEITHVHQRQVPFEFEELYSQWGYQATPMNQVRGMEGILQLNRNNPDGTSPDWLWRDGNKYWWIGAVFSSATPTTLSDVSLIAVKMEQDAQGNFYYLKQQPTPLNNLSSFLQYFGGASPNNYHPNEMSAKFAEWYLDDALGMPQNKNLEKQGGYQTGYQPGYQVYKNYFKKLLETYY
jgi:hypothetical protein